MASYLAKHRETLPLSYLYHWLWCPFTADTDVLLQSLSHYRYHYAWTHKMFPWILLDICHIEKFFI